MKNNQYNPLRPNKHVEDVLVTGILDGTFPIGSALPNERALSAQLGVTRPTLRETLQRLAKEGWVTIQHGKSTMINDYWQTGGLSLLGTLARYGRNLPDGFIDHLLEIRLVLLPPAALSAAKREPQAILTHLEQADSLADDAETFTNYDWNLQTLFARNSSNPVYLLILNDFESVFHMIAQYYFVHENARNASLRFYRALGDALSRQSGNIDQIVRSAIVESIQIWETIKA